ncbi:MAG: ASKHA domain-containing protein [Candidatus Hydrogenedentota bacterium]
MTEKELPVRFAPQGRTVDVLLGTKVLEAAARAGIAIRTPCGSQGTCGKCRVIVREGAGPVTDAEREALTEEELDGGMALACQRTIEAPATVEVPESSVLGSFHQILEAAGKPLEQGLAAPVAKVYKELPEPTLQDGLPDFERLQREIGPAGVDADVLPTLPGIMRASGFKGTAVLSAPDGEEAGRPRLIDWEAGDTAAACYAAAFDIGTTTLGGVLLDLHEGREIAAASVMNPQTAFGDDVLARIVHASKGPAELKTSQELVLDAVNGLLEEMVQDAGIAPGRIYTVTFAGNTTMQHLLMGIEPRALGEAPFAPVTASSMTIRADALGLNVHPRAAVYVFPVIGGFVGGDTVAGILSTNLDEAEEPTLLIDIGTNGEIVLWHEGGLIGASCAAGPAFEGGRIGQGMRATTGAIEKVLVQDGDIHCNVIGNTPPVGLCGSALIDATAELLRLGIIGSEGSMAGPDDLPDTVPPAIRARIGEGGGGYFELASAEESGAGEAIVITRKDISELQLATGAIRAGITILLEHAGLEPVDLERIHVAGGFGNFIRRKNAQRIGLLPCGIPHNRIGFVGNTSLAGARLAAASREARLRAFALARETRHIELSQDPDFHARFVEGIFFPAEEALGG